MVHSQQEILQDIIPMLRRYNCLNIETSGKALVRVTSTSHLIAGAIVEQIADYCRHNSVTWVVGANTDGKLVIVLN